MLNFPKIDKNQTNNNLFYYIKKRHHNGFKTTNISSTWS